MKLTPELAIAAATDAGNRAMRARGGKRWSKADYNAFAREYNRVYPYRCECCGEPAGEGNALCPVHLEEAKP